MGNINDDAHAHSIADIEILCYNGYSSAHIFSWSESLWTIYGLPGVWITLRAIRIKTSVYFVVS